MRIVLSTLKKILFWSYDRGTWQYDIMCVLILAFIFFGPNSIFHNHSSGPVFISGKIIQEIKESYKSKPGEETDVKKEQIEDYLARKDGRNVHISRIERVVDDSDRITGYNVWEE